jgi:soluble P-type ATPase
LAIIDIPGQNSLDLRHLVLDYNGTIALDGELLPGVVEKLAALAGEPFGLKVHVLTADTHGVAREKLKDVACELHIIGREAQDMAKLSFIRLLGLQHVVAIGNGSNDRLMLSEAVLGVAIIGGEGASLAALHAARVVCRDICEALDLLLRPLRLVATLRL